MTGVEEWAVGSAMAGRQEKVERQEGILFVAQAQVVARNQLIEIRGSNSWRAVAAHGVGALIVCKKKDDVWAFVRAVLSREAQCKKK